VAELPQQVEQVVLRPAQVKVARPPESESEA
jgi:hypothetical protein